jgi:hypothetical protein
MRIFERNVLNGVAKSVASGIQICNALAPTTLPLDYAAEVAETGTLIQISQRPDRDNLDLDLPMVSPNFL